MSLPDTDILASLSAPTVSPVSLATPSVPDVVSLLLDLK